MNSVVLTLASELRIRSHNPRSKCTCRFTGLFAGLARPVPSRLHLFSDQNIGSDRQPVLCFLCYNAACAVDGGLTTCRRRIFSRVAIKVSTSDLLVIWALSTRADVSKLRAFSFLVSHLVGEHQSDRSRWPPVISAVPFPNSRSR